MKASCLTPQRDKVGLEQEFVAVGEGGMATPNFAGFDPASTQMSRRMRIVERKVEELLKDRRAEKEDEIQDREFYKSLKDRVRKLEDNEKALRDENSKLREEVEKYKSLLHEGLGKVEKETEHMNEWREEQNIWMQDNNKKAFREVVQEQMKEKEKDMQEKVIGVIKSKETLIREITDKKKSVIVFGVKENNITYKPKRDKMEMKTVKDLLKTLNDEDRQNLEDEVEEIYRLGP